MSGAGAGEGADAVSKVLLLRAGGGSIGTLVGGMLYDRCGARAAMALAQAVSTAKLPTDAFPEITFYI